MKPGVSVANTGVLFQRRINAYADDVTTGSPPIHGTTSTSAITGAGLKKCKPTTRPGASHADAIDAIESDDVFVANTQLRDTAPSRWRKSDCLASSCSITASITSSQPRNGATSVSGSHR